MTNCYVCDVKVEDLSEHFPFCSEEHHIKWADEHYNSYSNGAKLSKFEEFLKNPGIMSEKGTR